MGVMNWGVGSGSLAAEISLIPAPRWQLSFGPSYERRVDSRQYVTRESGGSPATFGDRYIFAFTDRTTLAIETRLNFTFHPDLNLELYAQPLRGQRPLLRFRRARGGPEPLPPNVRDRWDKRRASGGWESGGAGRREHLRHLWPGLQRPLLPEYGRAPVGSGGPGSTLFLVWQQDRSRRLDQGSPVGIDDLLGSLAASGDNFFALKVS